MAFALGSTPALARPLLPHRDPDGRFARRPELPPEPLLTLAGEAEAATLDDVRREMEALLGGPNAQRVTHLPDTPDAIRRDLDALVGGAVEGKSPATGPAMGFPIAAEPDRPENFRLPDRVGISDLVSNYPDAIGVVAEPASALAARTLHLRRQLAAAIDHGADLLVALGLPRLVGPGFAPIDVRAAGDALDCAIAALDAFDPDPDLEPSLGYQSPDTAYDAECEPEHDEHSLGWREAVSQLDLGQGSPDGEHTLGAPERHPFVWTMTHPTYEPADGHRLLRHRRDASQASWAQGARQDGEGEAEPGYDLPEGDDERCASEHDGCEPSLGSSGHLDQERWADGNDGGSDRELDPLDDTHLNPPFDPLAWSERYALEQRAKDLRRRLRTGGTPMSRGGNLVPVDLRVLAAACPSLVGGARG